MSFWDDQKNNSYRGIPAEVFGEQTPIPDVAQPPAPTPSATTAQQSYREFEALIQTEEDEEYYNNLVLNDARLRLVQGSLYEKIMDHNLFDGYQADPIAIKNVEREIKKFARERMEIMLGMRQEKAVSTANQFTESEANFLKAVVSKATGGTSSSPELNRVAASTNQTLNPIGPSTKQTLTPIVAPRAQQPQQPRQPAPEPKAEQQQEGPPKLLQEMNEAERAEFVEKNRQKYARKSAPAGAVPMPSNTTEQMGYAAMAQTASGMSNTQTAMMRHIISTNK